MAEIAKYQIPSLANVENNLAGKTLTNLVPDEDLDEWDAVYMKSDGTIALATAESDDALAVVRGYNMDQAYEGQRGATLCFGGVTVRYANATLTPGASVYLSGTVPGGYADAPTFAGQDALGWCVDSSRIRFYERTPSGGQTYE